MSRSRRLAALLPRAVAEDSGGTEPDARFTFANERTFLAWSRTALALVVAGLAIVQLLPPFPGVPVGRLLLGLPLIALGGVLALPLDGADEAPEGAAFAGAISALARTILARKLHPVEGSYTAKLFAGGVDRISKKIGEEATEVVIAAKNADKGELVWETADLLYHALVLLAERGVSLDEVGAELSRRAKPAD